MIVAIRRKVGLVKTIAIPRLLQAQRTAGAVSSTCLLRQGIRSCAYKSPISLGFLRSSPIPIRCLSISGFRVLLDFSLCNLASRLVIACGPPPFRHRIPSGWSQVDRPRTSCRALVLGGIAPWLLAFRLFQVNTASQIRKLILLKMIVALSSFGKDGSFNSPRLNQSPNRILVII
ncbi:hypothetical protein NL676_029901 [Syzygium grande]|nr:hypothetical protein NL676_029901 [Syzygium grande]